MIIYITLVVVAIGVVAAAAFGVSRLRKTRQRKHDLRVFLNAVNTAPSDDELVKIRPSSSLIGYKYSTEESEAYRKIDAARNRIHARDLLAKAKSATGEERYVAFTNLNRFHAEQLSNDSKAFVAEELKQLTEIKASHLLAAARAADGNKRAFDQLDDLVNGSTYIRNTGHKLQCSDWNDLVARYCKLPELDMFDTKETNPKALGIRFMAAGAMESRSLTKALIVLAYCDDDKEYRKALGDVRHAELKLMVAQLRKEQARQEPTNPR